MRRERGSSYLFRRGTGSESGLVLFNHLFMTLGEDTVSCVFRFVAIRPAITMPVKYLAICDEQEKHKSAFGLRKHFPSS